MVNRSYYIGCFIKTSDSTACFQVKWIGSFYDKAVRLLQTHFKHHVLIDDRMLHYLLVDDDIGMDWTHVKEICGNA